MRFWTFLCFCMNIFVSTIIVHKKLALLYYIGYMLIMIFKYIGYTLKLHCNKPVDLLRNFMLPDFFICISVVVYHYFRLFSNSFVPFVLFQVTLTGSIWCGGLFVSQSCKHEETESGECKCYRVSWPNNTCSSCFVAHIKTVSPIKSMHTTHTAESEASFASKSKESCCGWEQRKCFW